MNKSKKYLIFFVEWQGMEEVFNKCQSYRGLWFKQVENFRNIYIFTTRLFSVKIHTLILQQMVQPKSYTVKI